MDKSSFSLLNYYTREHLSEKFALYEMHERLVKGENTSKLLGATGPPPKENTNDNIIPENVVDTNQNGAVVEEQPQQCPICLRIYSKVSYNRYDHHKKEYQDKNLCCICHKTFASQDELLLHASQYAQQRLCCSCAKHGAKNLIQRELQQFRNHTLRGCDSQQHYKKRKRSENSFYSNLSEEQSSKKAKSSKSSGSSSCYQ